jgi:RNA polymerase sigma factor (sigma-70 family)
MSDQLTDREIAKRLRSEDPHVLVDILRHYSGALHRRLRFRYPTVDVDDVVAVAIWKVWEQRHRYDPERGSFQPWFFRICQNAAIDMLRNQGLDALAYRDQKAPAPHELKAYLREHDSDVNPTITATLQHLQSELEGMSERDRQIVLNDPASDGLLAEKLGMTPGHVKVRRTRLVQRLRKDLR